MEDLAPQFAAWKSQVWPAMCEQYAQVSERGQDRFRVRGRFYKDRSSGQSQPTVTRSSFVWRLCVRASWAVHAKFEAFYPKQELTPHVMASCVVTSDCGCERQAGSRTSRRVVGLLRLLQHRQAQRRRLQGAQAGGWGLGGRVGVGVRVRVNCWCGRARVCVALTCTPCIHARVCLCGKVARSWEDMERANGAVAAPGVAAAKVRLWGGLGLGLGSRPGSSFGTRGGVVKG